MPADKEFIVTVILAACVFIVLFGVCVFLISASFSKRKRRFQAEQEKREAIFQQELLQAQMEMQEHTFKIISQDLHDNVGQILSLAKINLNIITLEQKENEAFMRIKELVTNAITELRHLGTGYYAERLVEQGLVNAIRHQLNQLSKTGMFITQFEADTEFIYIERNHLIFLYRIMQEVLNNVIKHSEASELRIAISHVGEDVKILVSDNGRGFSRSDDSFQPGIGLSSIEQRAAMIGATVLVNSIPGKGTEVHLSFKQTNHDKNSAGR